MWGGAVDPHESASAAAERELREESGYLGPVLLCPLWTYRHPSGFTYENFAAVVPDEFAPRLDWESQSYLWFSPTNPTHWPQPLHPGVLILLSQPRIFDDLFQVSM